MNNVFLIKRIMTMIALMSAILDFSTQKSFRIAFKNLKASWQFFPAICFQCFESKSLENFESFLKANRWKNC